MSHASIIRLQLESLVDAHEAIGSKRAVVGLSSNFVAKLARLPEARTDKTIDPAKMTETCRISVEIRGVTIYAGTERRLSELEQARVRRELQAQAHEDH